jgi:hypothetical protein
MTTIPDPQLLETAAEFQTLRRFTMTNVTLAAAGSRAKPHVTLSIRCRRAARKVED